MHQACPSKTSGVQVDRSEHVRVEPATGQVQAEEPVELTGLCGTCNHSPTCTFPRDEHRPVMFCGEFDGFVSATKTVAMAEKPTRTAQDQRICETDHSSKYRGLCRTCEHCDGCTFPKAEGGVWQCEEFL